MRFNSADGQLSHPELPDHILKLIRKCSFMTNNTFKINDLNDSEVGRLGFLVCDDLIVEITTN